MQMGDEGGGDPYEAWLDKIHVLFDGNILLCGEEGIEGVINFTEDLLTQLLASKSNLLDVSDQRGEDGRELALNKKEKKKRKSIFSFF